jgi:hypothetical protein
MSVEPLQVKQEIFLMNRSFIKLYSSIQNMTYVGMSTQKQLN